VVVKTSQLRATIAARVVLRRRRRPPILNRSCDGILAKGRAILREVVINYAYSWGTACTSD
jgi:hypothetical protein